MVNGGEAQRVKLAKELSRRATGQTLYILDEPTTGLNFEDVRKLLEVLHQLVEQGNTGVVIEHDLEITSYSCAAKGASSCVRSVTHAAQSGAKESESPGQEFGAG